MDHFPIIFFGSDFKEDNVLLLASGNLCFTVHYEESAKPFAYAKKQFAGTSTFIACLVEITSLYNIAPEVVLEERNLMRAIWFSLGLFALVALTEKVHRLCNL